MSSRTKRAFVGLALAAALGGLFPIETRGEDVPYARSRDVIYGRKFALALTLDVFQPKRDANGLGVVFVVSGGWFSTNELEGVIPLVQPLLNRGYTVFAVTHGSQPKFSIPEILPDLHRAVRFVRFHAKEFNVDPERLGVCGASAGGHLSLMQGCAGDAGTPDAADPIDRVSSRVQAVACFFPPTDFLNYGKPGENALGRGVLAAFPAPFEFREPTREPPPRLVPVTDPARIEEIGRQISPVNHASADDPPTLIVHGDKDELVPLQQAELMVEALKKANVEAKLSVKAGAAHGWPDMSADVVQFADWFDVHLKPRKPAEAAPHAAPANPAEAAKPAEASPATPPAPADAPK